MLTTFLERDLRLTVCGIGELAGHREGRATHVLSILDPGWPDPAAFTEYDPHHRLTLRFHDIIVDQRGMELPQPQHVEAIAAFGEELDNAGESVRHLIVHCHAGISRSTAALATLLARHTEQGDEPAIFAHLRSIRPQAWPNSRMIGFADELLGRQGQLTAALRQHYQLQAPTLPSFVALLPELGRATEMPQAAPAA